jgi:site-specific recombinase XerD
MSGAEKLTGGHDPGASELVFYLARGMKPSEAHKLFEDSEIRERRTKEIRHLKLPRRYVYSDEKRLTDVIRSLRDGSFLVVWSVDLMTTALPALKTAIKAKEGRNLNIMIYDKRLMIDPDSTFVQGMLEAFATIWYRKEDGKGSLSQEERSKAKEEGSRIVYVAVPHAPLAPERQAEIRELSLRGRSIKQISRELKVSQNTVIKYRRDIKGQIPPPRKEKRFSVSKRAEIELLKYPLIERDTAVWNSLFNFISGVPASKSQRSYATTMRMFFKLLQESGVKSITHPQEITAAHVVDARDLAMKKYREASARTVMQTASRYFTLLKRDGIIGDDYKALFATFHAQRHKVVTNPITGEWISAILQAAESELGRMRGAKDEVIAHRNFIAVLILSMTGFRAFSMLSLRKQDFSRRGAEYFLTPLIKRQGRVTMKIAPECGEEIEKYISRWFEHSPDDAHIIFSRQHGQLVPIEHDRLSKVIKDLSKKAGVKENVRPHTFRATFATELHKSGVKLEEIRLLMGHASIKQTLAYIKHYDIKPETSWIGWKRGKADDESVKRSRD